MKVLLVAAACAVALFTFGAAAASASPGYYVDETKASDLLERSWDHAYCMGVPRFGHRGSFPYEKYMVFDCTISSDDRMCDLRVKAITTRPGYWRLSNLRAPDCF